MISEHDVSSIKQLQENMIASFSGTELQLDNTIHPQLRCFLKALVF